MPAAHLFLSCDTTDHMETWAVIVCNNQMVLSPDSHTNQHTKGRNSATVLSFVLTEADSYSRSNLGTAAADL